MSVRFVVGPRVSVRHLNMQKESKMVKRQLRQRGGYSLACQDGNGF